MALGMVGADAAELRDLARRFTQASTDLQLLSARLTGVINATQAWSGMDAAQFRASWNSQHRALITSTQTALSQGAQLLTRNADEQDGASAASTGGEGPAGTGISAAAPTGVASAGRESRDPDGRDGRRERNDRVVGRDGSTSSSNDWAGRAILERYLTGGDDWTLDNDPDWRRYMTENANLRDGFDDNGTHYEGMRERNRDVAAAALRAYRSGGPSFGTFDERFHQAVENGEGAVGYQYLHGTAEPQGDFHHSGSTSVRDRGDGTYVVTMDAGYEWNDRIDPNPQYSTDRLKSKVAEVLTLGRADPYDIHIRWEETSSVVMDKNGTVLSGSGWPE